MNPVLLILGGLKIAKAVIVTSVETARELRQCPTCTGRGYMLRRASGPLDMPSEIEVTRIECSSCDGTGHDPRTAAERRATRRAAKHERKAGRNLSRRG